VTLFNFAFKNRVISLLMIKRLLKLRGFRRGWEKAGAWWQTLWRFSDYYPINWFNSNTRRKKIR